MSRSLSGPLGDEGFTRRVFPGDLRRFLHDSLLCVFQVHAGGSALAPGACGADECLRFGFDETGLLVRKQLDHSPGFVRITERGENFSVHAEIRMILVGILDGFRKAQRDAAKFSSGHWGGSALGVTRNATRNSTPSKPCVAAFTAMVRWST